MKPNFTFGNRSPAVRVQPPLVAIRSCEVPQFPMFIFCQEEKTSQTTIYPVVMFSLILAHNMHFRKDHTGKTIPPPGFANKLCIGNMKLMSILIVRLRSFGNLFTDGYHIFLSVARQITARIIEDVALLHWIHNQQQKQQREHTSSKI